MDAFSDNFNLSIDEYMAKFKGRFTAKQCLQLKPIKYGAGFKWWFNVPIVLAIYLNLDIKVNLGKEMVFDLTEKLEQTFNWFTLTTFSIVQYVAG